MQYSSGSAGQRLGDDLLPAPESHQHVQAHRDEALRPVGHRHRLDPQQVVRDDRGDVVGGLQRGVELPQEHRAVHLEMQVVAAVEGVEVERALPRQELAVGDDRLAVFDDDVEVVPAQQVDVGRHVHAGGRSRAPARAAARRRLGPLGERRHLHRVDVDVQQARVRARRRCRPPRRSPARAPPSPRACRRPPPAAACAGSKAATGCARSAPRRTGSPRRGRRRSARTPGASPWHSRRSRPCSRNRDIRRVARSHRLDQRALDRPFGSPSRRASAAARCPRATARRRSSAPNAGQSLLKFGPTA